MAVILAGIFLLGHAEITLDFTGVAIMFLPKLIQRAMKADADAIIEAFGKNEQVKKVFWTLFMAMAGIVLAEVADPVTPQQVLRAITGMGV
jgi:hypothetical protein